MGLGNTPPSTTGRGKLAGYYWSPAAESIIGNWSGPTESVQVLKSRRGGIGAWANVTTSEMGAGLAGGLRSGSRMELWALPQSGKHTVDGLSYGVWLCDGRYAAEQVMRNEVFFLLETPMMAFEEWGGV